LQERRTVKINPEILEIEKTLIRQEVKQMMDTILELGDGSVPKGAILALEQGIIDIPWSPNVYNANKVVNVRDVNGAVRFHDFGNLPFSNRVKEMHHEKVTVRKMMERDSSVFSLLEKDLSRIWKNDYVQWPLDNCYVN
jgi:methylaspartate mutase epsilon subunit